jgi:hypothetical protein
LVIKHKDYKNSALSGKDIISMKTLLLFLLLFSCSLVIASPFQFNQGREWGNCFFAFRDDDLEDSYVKGHYWFTYGPNSLIEERGIYEAHQTQDEYLTTTILITIKESTVKERVGISFSCQFWLLHLGSPHDPAYFSNAKQLTCGIAASDTILTNAVRVSVLDGKIKWSDVKRLFQTK